MQSLVLSILATSAFAQPQVAKFSSAPPIIDGIIDDTAWQAAPWYPIDKHILGDMPKPDDFSGRYKVTWDENQLYILAEITDDILIDQHADPRHNYWDDDTLEIFIDEDMSGGDHQYSYNAFAYHVALDGQAADFGPKNQDGSNNIVLLNNHLNSVWKRAPNAPNKVIWEVALSIYDDTFKQDTNSHPVHLSAGKKMGFMLAYCDNDGSKYREHFIGSHNIEPVNGDKNRGYIDASVFGTLKLIK